MSTSPEPSSKMQQFCSRCGSILPVPERAPYFLSCTLCGSETRLEAQTFLVSREERTYQKSNIEPKADEEEEEAATVERKCEKCGYRYASYSTQQTRSADEGQTVFYTCLKCKNRTIDYS